MSDQIMRLRFWGTRGSIPTPGALTDKYGGNTTCMDLRYGDTRLVFDSGSGIRELGQDWLASNSDSTIAHLLFTHLHWDHIQGFPFFAPAYAPSTRLHIYGEDKESGSVEELLGAQMHGGFFPVPISSMKSEITFHSTSERFEIDDIVVRTRSLPHPGGCLAYRIEAGNAVFILATDCELDEIALNREELQWNLQTPREYEPDFLEFFEGAGLIALDCQYTDEQYPTCRGWGHNSVATVVDFARQVQPAMLATVHHDPSSTDADISEMAGDMINRLNDNGMRIFPAREGLTLAIPPR